MTKDILPSPINDEIGEYVHVTALALRAAELIRYGDPVGRIYLREWQAFRGYDNMQAYQRIGCDRHTYRNWKSGRNWPSSFWMPAIASAFACTIEELYFPPPGA